MKIGFDAKRAYLNGTGLGNYSRTVMTNLSKEFPEHEYVAYSPKVKNNVFLQQLNELSNLKLVTAKGVMPGNFWRSYSLTGLVNEAKLDVYHGLSNELPFNARKMSCKKIVTIHDLIFESHPQLYPFFDRKMYHVKFKSACELSDSVIAASQFTKNQIVERYGVNPAKIEVVYQDVANVFKVDYAAEDLDLVQRKYHLPEHFLLQVGSIEERKNAKLSILSLKKSKHDLPLVLVGKFTSYVDELKQVVVSEGLENRVIFLHDVTFFDLPLIYRLAAVFLYPSRIEGFGIPILESLHAGVPVIAATGSCLEETGGAFSSYVDPDDAAELGDKVDAILAGQCALDPVELQAHLSRFEQSFLTKQLMDLYQK